MKQQYKLIYKEDGETITVISDDPNTLLIVLHTKVSASIIKYRASKVFELISYGKTSEK